MNAAGLRRVISERMARFIAPQETADAATRCGLSRASRGVAPDEAALFLAVGHPAARWLTLAQAKQHVPERHDVAEALEELALLVSCDSSSLERVLLHGGLMLAAVPHAMPDGAPGLKLLTVPGSRGRSLMLFSTTASLAVAGFSHVRLCLLPCGDIWTLMSRCGLDRALLDPGGWSAFLLGPHHVARLSAATHIAPFVCAAEALAPDAG